MLQTFFEKDRVEVGCDEVGRGCLAGPVVAAAVILPQDFNHPLLRDSKKLSLKKRDLIQKEIENNAIDFAVAEVDNLEIDKINILNASFLAMHRALDQLSEGFESILVDGNRFTKYQDYQHTCVVKGDDKFTSIAAASILAKNHRDDLMARYAREYPGYGWEKNVGYPTKQHRQGIVDLGITPLHRKSFQLLPTQMDLFS